jgi:uncharacterized membrane protein (DUF2068 family)
MRDAAIESPPPGNAPARNLAVDTSPVGMTESPVAAAPKKRAAGLYTIIAIKGGKALLFLLLSLGIYSLIGDDLRAELNRFLRWLHLDPEREFFAELGRNLQGLSPDRLGWLASGTLLYSLLLLTETLGLARRSYWAVWLAIGETAFFVPIELFDLLRDPSGVVTGILIINLLIVVYLVRNRNRLFHHHHHHHHE